MEIATVIGGGGTKLHVREWGRRDASPILFVHGWSQHHLAFRRQLESPLSNDFRLVALDLRGHGMSEMPTDLAAYTNGDIWAADIAAVIEQRGLKRPVIVAWSYGGYVVSDYLERHGDGNVAGVNYVGWSVVVGEPRRISSALASTIFMKDRSPTTCRSRSRRCAASSMPAWGCRSRRRIWRRSSPSTA